ncbi:MAG: septum site-determining protein MinC, partial [Roseburia sp.]|nr:septum site-determining protein MinC [Roseburia sp.]
MGQAVIIKSCKSGITLVLNPALSFDTLLAEILKKFQESEKFFTNARFALSFEGRELTEEEQYQIVETITAHTSIDILCIITDDKLRDTVIDEIVKEKAAEEDFHKRTVGSFYRGSLLPHELLQTDESVVILGDVPKGASIVSKSYIIVLGALYGKAYAGMDGKGTAILAALDF